MQPALALGHGQGVVGQREVVHADVVVARGLERRQRARQHRHLVGCTRQVDGDDAPLRLEALGQVRVGVQRDAVGPQLGHLGQRAVEGFGRLLGQAVDQVDVDRLEADLARRGDQGKHLLGRLDAVHRLLHDGVEILHAERQAVEAQLRQVAQPLGRHGARVDLDGVFAPRHQAEVAPQHGHQLAQLVVAEEGGRAAAQVQLADGLAGADARHVQVHLAAQVAQVGRAAVVVLGDDLVAGAVVAQRFAERNVHVQRQRQRHGGRAGAALLQRLDVIGLAERLDEAVRRRVRGVARPGHVEFGEQFGGDGLHRTSFD